MNDTADLALNSDVDRGGPAQPLLVVRNLKKYFPVRGDFFQREKKFVHAVDDVSFSVAKGRTLGIVGESGCGKSTTARLIARLMMPDAGSLIFDGEGVAEFGGLALKAFRSSLQMVFQDSFASLNPRLTICETIAYGPQAHGMPVAQATARARALLTRVGLEPAQFSSRYPHELSGGQRQRVNIARALALEPRLVILDEAVAALDKSVQAQVLNLLQELKAERQLTYLFISHDLHVVHYISDDVMVMYLGQVVEMGPVEQIYGSAAHPYTRALLSAVPSMDPAHRTERSPLSGDPPNPINPPGGCRFRERCAHAQTVCGLEMPALTPARRMEPMAPPMLMQLPLHRSTGMAVPTARTGMHVVACHMNDPHSGHTEALTQGAP